MTDDTPIPPPDWEALISVIADEIMAERSPARILQVRAKLYDLLTHCIPPTTILRVIRNLQFIALNSILIVPQTLTFKLIPKIDDALKPEIIKWAAFYEHRIKLGSVSSRNKKDNSREQHANSSISQKVIFHLEAFVAKFMRVLERLVNTHAPQLNGKFLGLFSFLTNNMTAI